MFACRLFFSLEKHKEQNVTIIYCLLRIGVKGVELCFFVSPAIAGLLLLVL